MTDYVQANPGVDLASESRVPDWAPPAARDVTSERIRDARSEPENWLTYYGAYDGKRYSPLEGINTGNVKRLAPAWVFQFGPIGLQAGEIAWHYQYNPHDLWDYDSNMESILFEHGGRKLLRHFNKNGYHFVLDRTNGELVRVVLFCDRITWGEISSDGTVTPKVYPDKEGEAVHFYPGPGGVKEWTHACYNPHTNCFYVPVQAPGRASPGDAWSSPRACPTGERVSPSTTPTCGAMSRAVAVPVGWGGWIEGFAAGFMGRPRGDALLVVALPQE
jgi:glucose dehydrogenase